MLDNGIDCLWALWIIIIPAGGCGSAGSYLGIGLLMLKVFDYVAFKGTHPWLFKEASSIYGSHSTYQRSLIDPKQVLIISECFIAESCGVQADVDCKGEVEEIRAQGVEQSDLLRNVRGERTNLPLSSAEKPSSYF